MNDCNHGSPQHHKHLTDAEIQKLFAEVFKAHVKLIRGVQERLHKDGVCESDFVNMLLSVVIRAASQTIEHLTVSAKMTKQDAVNLVMGGIAEEVGFKIATVNEAELMGKMRKAMNATTH